jgi:hypothetical protein
MNDITHEEARRVIQASMDRKISEGEDQALERHLNACQDCADYYRTHKWLESHARLDFPRSLADEKELKVALPTIMQGTTRRKRGRFVIKAIQYSVLLAIGIFMGVAAFPLLGDLAAGLGSGSAVPALEPVSSPTIAATARATSLLPAASPTPIAEIHFGKQVPWTDVRYFERGPSDIVDAGALRPDSQRENHLRLEEVSTRADFRLRVPSVLPPGYAFDDAWYDPSEQSVGICYAGPPNQRVPRLGHPTVCIVQQPEAFQDFVGHSADVFETSVGDAYAEYVQGGWLGLPEGWSLTEGWSAKQYQWDGRMVPVTQLRFVGDEIYIQISSMLLECPEPVCADMMEIAESLN